MFWNKIRTKMLETDMHNGSKIFQNLNSFGWVIHEKAPNYQDQHAFFHASMPPNIGFSFSFFLATNVIVFLINFHYSFFLLDTDAALDITFKAISPITKLFHTQLVFSVSWKFKQKGILKVTLKQQTNDYLITTIY